MALRARHVTLFTLLPSVLLLGSSLCWAQKQPNQIHYPLNDELATVLQRADASRKAGKFKEAAALYQRVLDEDAQAQTFQVARWPKDFAEGGPVKGRLIGITEWAHRGLRLLPAKGVASYRHQVDFRAKAARAEALKQPQPFLALSRVYDRYPRATEAAQILESMADLALERGQLERAQRVSELLLEHHAEELKNPPRIRRKLLVCAVGLGQLERVRELALELKREDPKAPLRLGARVHTLEELVTFAYEVESRRQGRTPGSLPNAFKVRGDLGNRAFTRTSPVVGRARYPRPIRFASRNMPMRSRFSHRSLGGALSARHLPVVHEGQVFMTTADGIHVFDLESGKRTRRIRRPLTRPSYNDRNPKVLFGSAVEQGVLVTPLVEEVLLDQSYRGIPIKVQIPLRKLVGFDLDRRRWRWRWDHARLLAKTPLAKWSFPTPPLAHEGVVYASAFSMEGFINCYVAAFEARSGKKLWGTWIASGQVEQTMFGEVATEPLCTPVAYHRGVIYHSTSFGCVAALSADTGRPLWLTEYDQIEVRAAKGYWPDMRTVVWESNAPVVEQGVLVATPLDSGSYYGFDLRTGRRVWARAQQRGHFAAEPAMRYVLGAADGRVVLGGGHDVICVDVRSGKLKWRRGLRGRMVAGRGWVSGVSASRRVVSVPLDNRTLLTLDLAQGRSQGSYRLGTRGNLLAVGDHLLVAGNGELVTHQLGRALPARPPHRRSGGRRPPGPAPGRDFK